MYVLAGWIIPKPSVAAANALVKGLRQTLKVQATELHGKRLLKSPRGLRATAQTFEALGQVGCLPIFVIAEKRYCVTAKIVETFLDPVYNSMVTNEMTWDLTGKQHVANILYELLPSSYISSFWQIYRSLNTDKLKAFLIDFCRVLSLGLRTDLSHLFSGALGYTDQIVEGISGARSIHKGSGLESLNLTILLSFLSFVEGFARPVGVKVHIFHDETLEFEVEFRSLFEDFFKNIKPTEMVFPNRKKFLFGSESLKEFHTVPSHFCPLIQVADLLARSLCKYANERIQRKAISKELLDLVELTLPAALLAAPKLGDIIGSRLFLQELFHPILQSNK